MLAAFDFSEAVLYSGSRMAEIFRFYYETSAQEILEIAEGFH
jgi:hypothetical protein